MHAARALGRACDSYTRCCLDSVAQSATVTVEPARITLTNGQPDFRDSDLLSDSLGSHGAAVLHCDPR